MLLTVFRYAVFRFVLVKKTKSAKNIWEPVIEEVIKRPLRDACLCMGELPAPPAPPAPAAPHFVFLITL